MADTASRRRKSIEARRNAESENAIPCSYWPSRPGQEQYEWEEPRVVADNVNATGGSSTKQQKRKKRRTPTNDSSLHGKESKDINETKSKLGGTTDGTSGGVDPTANRIDRLRLLGNGVVPNTCERAIRILLERLHSE